MVKCNTCGLVRSDPVADPQSLAKLYESSSFDYGEEVPCLNSTYGRYLKKLEPCNKDSLLEIGCGNGFFLEEALKHGYKQVYGVEPSSSAVAQARPTVQSNIVCDIMRPGLFQSEQFDAICIFQVFDHISDPSAMLDECWRVLKPHGQILILNHNINAVSSRLLGERSPIIDIEHTYLYSPSTLANLVQAHHFEVKSNGSVLNRYSLKYLIRLIPIPRAVKALLLNSLGSSQMGRLNISVPLGNLFLIASKGKRNERAI